MLERYINSDNFNKQLETGNDSLNERNILNNTKNDLNSLSNERIDIKKMNTLLIWKRNAIGAFAKHFEANMTTYDKARLLGIDVDSIEEGDIQNWLIEYFGVDKELEKKKLGNSFTSNFNYKTKSLDGLDPSLISMIKEFEDGNDKVKGYNHIGIFYNKKIQNLKNITNYWKGNLNEITKFQQQTEQREKEQLLDEIETYKNRLIDIKNDDIYKNNSNKKQEIQNLIDSFSTDIDDLDNNGLKEYISNINKSDSKYNIILNQYRKDLKKDNLNKDNGNIETRKLSNSAKVRKFIVDNFIGTKYKRGEGRFNKDIDNQKKLGLDCSGMVIYAMRHFGLKPPGRNASSMFNKTKNDTIKSDGFSSNSDLLKYKDQIKPGQILFWKGHGGKYPESYRGNGIHHVALLGDPAIIDGKLNVIQATPPRLKQGTIDIDKIRKNKKHYSTIHIHNLDYG